MKTINNLVDGKILSTIECDKILEKLEYKLIKTLNKTRLDSNIVIDACHNLISNLDEQYYIDVMSEFGIEPALANKYMEEARLMFSRDSLLNRLETELGQDYLSPKTFIPISSGRKISEQILPLGVLLHIPAGNSDGLPIFSVLEGLLTGNINILKLPSVDGGMTIRLLLELFKIEPLLKEYVYVFDYSSSDIINIQRLLDIADGVVIWGGDTAIKTLRGMIKPNTKIIEWGHKISFSYITEKQITHENLKKIAYNIATTDQLLCSSCQGVYIDAEDINIVYNFCKEFIIALDTVYKERGKSYDIGINSQNAIKLYTMELEKIYDYDKKIFKGEDCAVIAHSDSRLVTSEQFGIVWVKRLNRNKIIETLRPHKNHLQTVGLVCDESEKKEITEIFSKIGVVKICSPERMSTTYSNAPHDGEYPLRRYTKVFSVE